LQKVLAFRSKKLRTLERVVRYRKLTLRLAHISLGWPCSPHNLMKVHVAEREPTLLPHAQC